MPAKVEEGWAKPGVEVVKTHSGFTLQRYGTRHRIAKVHRNGNFVLEGSQQQYRPWSNGTANATGDAWSKASVQMVTPDVLAAIETEQRVMAARKIVRAWADHLTDLGRSRDDEAIIAAADQLAPLQDRDGEVNRG